jgi:hypothetical protein
MIHNVTDLWYGLALFTDQLIFRFSTRWEEPPGRSGVRQLGACGTISGGEEWKPKTLISALLPDLVRYSWCVP